MTTKISIEGESINSIISIKEGTEINLNIKKLLALRERSEKMQARRDLMEVGIDCIRDDGDFTFLVLRENKIANDSVMFILNGRLKKYKSEHYIVTICGQGRVNFETTDGMNVNVRRVDEMVTLRK